MFAPAANAFSAAPASTTTRKDGSAATSSSRATRASRTDALRTLTGGWSIVTRAIPPRRSSRTRGVDDSDIVARPEPDIYARWGRSTRPRGYGAGGVGPVVRALVTGGGQGIGAATVRTLAADGFDVAVHAHLHPREAEEESAQARASGRESFVVLGDLGTSAGVREVVDG